MNEERKFSKEGDNIKVVVTYKDQEVYVPVNGEQLTIGNQESVVTQIITDVKNFHDFMKEQKKSAEEQLKKLKMELSKLEHINTDLLPESVRLDLEKYLSKKASKATMNSLKDLTTYLSQANSKRDKTRWIEHLEKQYSEITAQLTEIEKLL